VHPNDIMVICMVLVCICVAILFVHNNPTGYFVQTIAVSLQDYCRRIHHKRMTNTATASRDQGHDGCGKRQHITRNTRSESVQIQSCLSGLREEQESPTDCHGDPNYPPLPGTENVLSALLYRRWRGRRTNRVSRCHINGAHRSG